MVEIDGEPLRSCVTLAEHLAWNDVVTLRLRRGSRLHTVEMTR